MGGNQSVPDRNTRINEKLVVDRLQALQVKDQVAEQEDGYISINKEKAGMQKYVSKSPSLSVTSVEQWQHELLEDPKNRLALSALSSADPKTVLTSRATTIEDQHIFNVQLPFEGAPVTNQRASGRCWLFASTNVFRIALMQRYHLASFELSQAYLFFWDKLEKANYFLEQILDTADEALDSRLLQTLLQDPVSDGGQWDMVVNLVNKYGLVPQVLYPDSYSAQSSGAIDGLITTKLREDALILRDLMSKSSSSDNIAATKEKFIREIHLILTLTLGPPPSPDKSFTWTYINAATSKPGTLTTTPLKFAADLTTSSPKPALALPLRTLRTSSHGHITHPIALADTISLVHDPRHEYYIHLTVSRLNNIFSPSSKPITYINVPLSILKSSCISMLRANQPIFFGSDVGQFSSSSSFPGPNASGVMDNHLIDWSLGFSGLSLKLTKAQRLMTGESQMTHAMVLTGVHLHELSSDEKEKEGKPIRWRVMNSWGDTAGDKGYFVMSDSWLDQFVYQAVVGVKFVPKEVRDVLDKDPVVLPRWDPLGALA